MALDIVVRPFEEGDETGIIQLLKLVFRGWPPFDIRCTPLEHWRWKYQDNPSKMSHIIVALKKGNIIGCSHSIQFPMKVGKTTVLGSNGYDVAVHPDFRGMHISSKLEKLRNELRKASGVKFAPRSSGNSLLIKHFSKRYPTFPHVVCEYVRIRDINLHLRNQRINHIYIKKLGFQIIKQFNKIRRLKKPSIPSESIFNIYQIRSFDEEINSFWENIREHYSFIIEKRRDYLNCRYCDLRAGKFVVNIAKKRKK